MKFTIPRVPKHVADRRRSNLLGLYAASGESSFAKWLRDNGDLDYNYMNQVRNDHKQIGDVWRERIETAMRLLPGDLDRADLIGSEENNRKAESIAELLYRIADPSVLELAEKVAQYGARGSLTREQALAVTSVLDSIANPKP